MRTLLAIALVITLFGCQHFQNTIGCYSETELGLGYAHNFGSNDIKGDTLFVYVDGNTYPEDRVDTSLVLHFTPGACR